MAAIACNLDHVLVRRVAAMIAAIIVIAGNGTPTALVFTPAIIFISHLVFISLSSKFCESQTKAHCCDLH